MAVLAAAAKHILRGLERALPENRPWHELTDYSLYSAEQPATFWREHHHSCTQVMIALDPASIRAPGTPSIGNLAEVVFQSFHQGSRIAFPGTAVQLS